MTKAKELDPLIQGQNDGALKWFPVLMYHHVVLRHQPSSEQVEVTIDEFDQQMKYLRDHGYKSIHLDEAVQVITRGKGTVEKPVVITFDDGYLDVFLHAFPILRKYNFTADLFLVNSYIGGSNDRSAGPTSRLSFLGLPEIQEMASYGISFGSHSINHRRLTKLSDQEAWEEIQGSKVLLERILGLPVYSFSFPHGCSTPELQQMVGEAGYLAACGVEQREHALYNLSRIDAAKCRGADLRWRAHISGLYFHLRQRNSLRRLKDFVFQLKPNSNRDDIESRPHSAKDVSDER